MDIELKLTTPERLVECLALPATRISMGHDACPHKLPTVGELRRVAEQVRRAGRRFGLVLPIAYESFQQQLVERVETLRADGPVDIVVNDWGTLLRVADRRTEAEGRLGVGVGLSFSNEYQPGVHQQNGKIQQALLCNSLWDPDLVPLLERCSVSEVQLSTLAADVASSELLRAKGFRITSVMDHVAVAFSRSCHTARHRGLSPPDCRAACDGAYQLSVAQRWRLFDNQYSPIQLRTRSALPTLKVFGNVVYRKVESDACPTHADYCSLDVRFYSVDDLARRTAALSSDVHCN